MPPQGNPFCQESSGPCSVLTSCSGSPCCPGSSGSVFCPPVLPEACSPVSDALSLGWLCPAPCAAAGSLSFPDAPLPAVQSPSMLPPNTPFPAAPFFSVLPAVLFPVVPFPAILSPDLWLPGAPVCMDGGIPPFQSFSGVIPEKRLQSIPLLLTVSMAFCIQSRHTSIPPGRVIIFPALLSERLHT